MDCKIAVLLCFFSCLDLSRTQPYVVNTTLGEFRGKKPFLSNIIEYLGVPYAEPPIEQYRFQPPQEKMQFDGVYDATDYKDACYQDQDNLADYLSGSSETTDEELSPTVNEDCLFLNIYTPVSPEETDRFLPVMVFLHGGGFVSGTGSAYKGLRLADNGEVVVVTINYRLGVFGFLSDSTSAITGNYGLQDQQMAITWIKDYIEAFGGNPDSITLFGEEAGGSSVHIHALRLGSDQIFHNAIIQSAQYDDGVLTAEQCKDHFEVYISELGLDVSDSDLLSTLQNLTSEELFEASQLIEPWRPCIDHKLIHEFPQMTIQNSTFNSELNLLIGTNAEVVSGATYDVTSDEWISNITKEIVMSSFPQLYENITNAQIDQMTKNYLQFYAISPEEDLTETERTAFIERTFGDQLYKTWVQEIAWETSEKSAFPVYNYLFTRSSDGNPTQIASLSSELPFIFGYRAFTNAEDLALQMAMMRFWTNFAKTGNPNPNSSSSLDWPQYIAYDCSTECRQSLTIRAVGSTPTTNEVVSRNWKFWSDYHHFLEFSCSENATSGSTDDAGDTGSPVECFCEPSVKDAVGLNVSNEDAAIMLIVFICTTTLFLLVSIITSVCCCLYKKRVKKMKKRNKKARGGNDNPTMSEYKL